MMMDAAIFFGMAAMFAQLGVGLTLNNDRTWAVLAMFGASVCVFIALIPGVSS